MTTIQTLLIAGFVILLLMLLSNPGNLKIQASKKIIGVLFVCAAIFFIVFPEKSNDIAHMLGVGRGADLLLYILTLAFIFVSLNFYLQIKEEQNKNVKLARKIAIIEANQVEKSKKSNQRK